MGIKNHFRSAKKMRKGTAGTIWTHRIANLLACPTKNLPGHERECKGGGKGKKRKGGARTSHSPEGVM